MENMETVVKVFRCVNSQDLISDSPYYLPFNSDDASPLNLVLDQLIVP